MTTPLMGRRLRALREQRGLSQKELADIFGIKDRQTVSAIESGDRRMTAEELVTAVQKLNVSLEYFTDPFSLDGEARFSWRQTDVGLDALDAYERVAGRWIAAFRVMARETGQPLPLFRDAVALTTSNTFEDASWAGECFVSHYELGVTPAAKLAEVMQNDLGILVLLVDATTGISGAACHLLDLDAVLINRREVIGRRNFDLAHELFHILTWEAMPPERSEEASETGNNRVEQLANSFASAVLMPESSIKRFGDWSHLDGERLTRKLIETADELHVTATALKWRLVSMKLLSRSRAQEIPGDALRNNGHGTVAGATSPLFSKRFVEVMGISLQQGRVSARRLAKVLDLTVDDLLALFPAHGLEPPIDL